jgi:hypothetical protein
MFRTGTPPSSPGVAVTSSASGCALSIFSAGPTPWRIGAVTHDKRVNPGGEAPGELPRDATLDEDADAPADIDFTVSGPRFQ